MQGMCTGPDLLRMAARCLGLVLSLLGRLEAGLGLHGVQVRLLGVLQRLQGLVVVVLHCP